MQQQRKQNKSKQNKTVVVERFVLNKKNKYYLDPGTGTLILLPINVVLTLTAVNVRKKVRLT
jgi:hypothetical protein